MSILSTANIFVTGGAGTLGHAIAARRKHEGWTGKFTVYSTDTHKHEQMRKLYPDINFVQGDIRNPETLYLSMVGHDVCLHLAAVKVIPASEYYTLDTIDVNVNGSLNVCIQAKAAGIKHVLGISTDKACHPANAYGATKMLMEKMFQEFSRSESDTHFHLLRYGNVLESTGSVIEAWKNAIERGEPIKITNPNMTRFWLSPQEAVDYVIDAIEVKDGWIYVPKMKALSIRKLAEYILGDNFPVVRVPLRPGEKMHECLVTEDELPHTFPNLGSTKAYFEISPSTSEMYPYHIAVQPFTSDVAIELTKEDLELLLENRMPDESAS